MWNNGGPNWHNGENACQISIHNYCFVDTQGTPRVTRCNGQIVSPSGTLPLPGCLPKTYVSTTYDTGKVAPYFEIAQKYGFANYFFQTNQGPSFPRTSVLVLWNFGSYRNYRPDSWTTPELCLGKSH